LARGVGARVGTLPFATRVLLENLLRHEDGEAVTSADIEALASDVGAAERGMPFHPVRVLMPDSSGVPLVADLAMMRDAIAARGVSPHRVNSSLTVQRS
jgi:aconitate hydratase